MITDPHEERAKAAFIRYLIAEGLNPDLPINQWLNQSKTCRDGWRRGSQIVWQVWRQTDMTEGRGVLSPVNDAVFTTEQAAWDSVNHLDGVFGRFPGRNCYPLAKLIGCTSWQEAKQRLGEPIDYDVRPLVVAIDSATTSEIIPSPLPWRIYDRSGLMIVDAEGMEVAVLDRPATRPIPLKARANAELIVQAVNATTGSAKE